MVGLHLPGTLRLFHQQDGVLLHQPSLTDVEVDPNAGVCEVQLDSLDFQLTGITSGICCSSCSQMVIKSTVTHLFIPPITLCGKLSAKSNADPLDNLRTDHPHLYLHIEDIPFDRKVEKVTNPDNKWPAWSTMTTSTWYLACAGLPCPATPRLRLDTRCSRGQNAFLLISFNI